ncbi:MAG: acyl carrier protein [Cellvibrionaceae bacterium]|jgi:acyl carrier protein
MQKQLFDYIQDSLGVDEEITAESELFSAGVLDSVAIKQLIMFIETTAEIRVRPEDVTLDNFDSVAKMVGYVERESPGCK